MELIGDSKSKPIKFDVFISHDVERIKVVYNYLLERKERLNNKLRCESKKYFFSTLNMITEVDTLMKNLDEFRTNECLKNKKIYDER